MWISVDAAKCSGFALWSGDTLKWAGTLKPYGSTGMHKVQMTNGTDSRLEYIDSEFSAWMLLIAPCSDRLIIEDGFVGYVANDTQKKLLATATDIVDAIRCEDYPEAHNLAESMASIAKRSVPKQHMLARTSLSLAERRGRIIAWAQTAGCPADAISKLTPSAWRKRIGDRHNFKWPRGRDAKKRKAIETVQRLYGLTLSDDAADAVLVGASQLN